MVAIVKVGSEFQVNTQDSTALASPSIAQLDNNGFAITWFNISNLVNGTSDSNIELQIFDANGSKIGNEIVANTETASFQFSSRIAGLVDGNFVVTWFDFSGTLGDANAPSIKAQLFNESGGRLGTEFLVNTQTANAQTTPTITGLASGGFVVSWQDSSGTLGDNDGQSVKAQIFDAAGIRVGGEFLVNSQTQGEQSSPTTTSLTNGGFLVSWMDRSGTLGDASGYSIKAQIFDAEGARIGTEFLINTAIAGDQLYPVIASLEGGGFVASWQDAGGTLGDASGTSIKAQSFDALGAKVGSEYRVNTETAGDQSNPSIAGIADGGFVVSWRDASRTLGDSSDTSIKAQVFNAAGTAVGTEFLVNTNTFASQASPYVTGLADGRFVISWVDGSLSPRIKAQIFDVVDGFTAPSITSDSGGYGAAVSAAENQTAVTTVSATDPDIGTVLSYSLNGGADAALFRVDTETGQLSFLAAPNFENRTDANFDGVYDVVVRVSDGSLFDEQAIAVTVVNTNEAPQIFSFGGGDTAALIKTENNQYAGLVSATDPDLGTLLHYSIVGGADASLFQILDDVGSVSFIVAPDFEAPSDTDADGVYEVVVRASDGSLFDEQAWSITIADAYEIPLQSFTGTAAADSFTVSNTQGWSIIGLNGADTLTGGVNVDFITGGRGNDALAGGAGDDDFYVRRGDGIDSFDGGSGTDRIYAFSANTKIGISRLAGIEVITSGGNPGVIIVGTWAADTLDFSGVSLLEIESINGGGGKDVIIGSAGDDLILGDGGADRLTGGDGADTFAYLASTHSPRGVGADVIADFVSGQDRIDLSGIDAIADIAGNQDFIFIGSAAFTGLGQLRIGVDGNGNTALLGNTSGNLTADFQISFLGAPAIQPADILL